MPYTDKAKAKEAARERQRKHRSVTPKEMSRPRVTPAGNDRSILPPERIEAIDRVLAMRKQLGLENDTTERYSRAIEYRAWEISGDSLV